MSEKLGPVSFSENEHITFMGKEIGEQQNYSDAVAAEIDKEVARFIEDAQKTANLILKKKHKTLAKIARVLIEKETIEKEEFEKLVGKKKNMRA